MTIRYRVPKKKRMGIAPIPLARPKRLKAVPGESHKYKLRTTPTDGNSPQYELTVAYFNTGTCEEWLLFRKNLNKVIKGLNLTTGTTKFELARNLLTGDALSVFNTAASDNTIALTETNQSFETCLDHVAYAVFPARAELLQKRYMRRRLEKPDDMTMREFMSRITEINEYFPQFPPDYNGNRTTGLSESELVEIGEYAIPTEWQNTMHLHNLDPLTAGVADFIEFCERLESLVTGREEEEEVSDKRKRKRKQRGKRKSDDSDDHETGQHYCMLHGKGGHSTDDCFQLKGMSNDIKRQKTDSNGSTKKKYRNTKYNRDSGKPKYTQNELNTIVNAMVRKAKAGTKKRKRAVDTTEQELHNFDNLSISGSEPTGSDDNEETHPNSDDGEDSVSESSAASDDS